MASSRDSNPSPDQDRLRLAAERHRLACAENLVAKPAPFYDLANVEFQLGERESGLAALLRGLDVNPHVARMLTDGRDLPAAGENPPSGSEEEAAAYLTQAESWPESSLRMLRRVLSDPDVARALDQVSVREAELDEMPTSARRYDLLERLIADRRDLFGTEAADALNRRLLLAEESS